MKQRGTAKEATHAHFTLEKPYTCAEIEAERARISQQIYFAHRRIHKYVWVSIVAVIVLAVAFILSISYLPWAALLIVVTVLLWAKFEKEEHVRGLRWDLEDLQEVTPAWLDSGTWARKEWNAAIAWESAKPYFCAVREQGRGITRKEVSLLVEQAKRAKMEDLISKAYEHCT